MATTNISSNIGDVSSYSSRMVTIAVTGLHQQSMRLASQTVSVSYNRLSQAIRNIHRSGGKIIDMSISPMSVEPVEEAASEQQNSNPGSKKKKR